MTADVALSTQQSPRRYRQAILAGTTLYRRACLREYFFQGIQTFHFSQASEAMPVIFHVVTFVVLIAFCGFLFSLNHSVGLFNLGFLCFLGAIYVLLTLLSNVWPNFPYRTPFSRDSHKWIIVVSLELVLLVLQFLYFFIPSNKLRMACDHLRHLARSSRWTVDDAIQSQTEINQRILQLAAGTVDDDGIERFIEGVSELLGATTHGNAEPIVLGLLDPRQPKPLGLHIDYLIQTCTADEYLGHNENLRRRRALICLDALHRLTALHHEVNGPTPYPYELFGDNTWPSVYSLMLDRNPIVAIHAISTGALMAWARLQFVFASKKNTPDQKPANIKHFRQFINTEWDGVNFHSFTGCYLFVLEGFFSRFFPGELPSLALVTPKSFHVVRTTAAWILRMRPVQPLHVSDSQSKENFLKFYHRVLASSESEQKPEIDVGESLFVWMEEFLSPLAKECTEVPVQPLMFRTPPL
jgi:hypothetical protein